MKKSLQLQEQRGVLDEKRTGILDAIEKRDTKAATDKEMTDLKEIRTQIADLDKQIADAQFLEEEQRSAAQSKAAGTFAIGAPRNLNGEDGDKASKRAQFRFLNVAKALANNQPLPGLEAEMHQEAVKEARDAQAPVGTGFGVPSWIAGREHRDQVVGTPSAGGYAVATELKPQLIEVLEPKLVTESMGIQVMPGQVGNVTFAKQTTYATAAWETEQGAADETDTALGLVTLAPKRLAAWTDISLMQMVQSTIVNENYVRRNLQNAIQRKVDEAVISGTGSGQPTGILTFLDVANTVVGGTNGLAPTYDNIIDLMSKIEIQNAILGTLGYLTTPGVKGKLMKTKIDAGSGLFVWAQNAKELNGFRAEVSTQVPSTLDKGSATDICHAIICGDFSQYMLAQWAGVFLDLDKSTRVTEGTYRFVVNSFWDGNSRHDESFSAMIDALVS